MTKLLINWLTDWLVDWLINYLIDCLTDWSVKHDGDSAPNGLLWQANYGIWELVYEQVVYTHAAWGGNVNQIMFGNQVPGETYDISLVLGESWQS